VPNGTADVFRQCGLQVHLQGSLIAQRSHIDRILQQGIDDRCPRSWGLLFRFGDGVSVDISRVSAGLYGGKSACPFGIRKLLLRHVPDFAYEIAGIPHLRNSSDPPASELEPFLLEPALTDIGPEEGVVVGPPASLRSGRTALISRTRLRNPKVRKYLGRTSQRAEVRLPDGVRELLQLRLNVSGKRVGVGC
jgi:hypothetical protein